MKKIRTPWPALVLLIGLAMSFGGCRKTAPYAPAGELTSASQRTLSLIKSGIGYSGGELAVSEGSSFRVHEQTLVPPSRLDPAEQVSLTMQVERHTDNAIVFTFGPCGTRFERPAEIILSFADLDHCVDDVVLYYIDGSGRRMEQETPVIDRKNKLVTFQIHHFSRYAVVHGN